MQNIISGQPLDYPIPIVRTVSINQYMKQVKAVGIPQ
jgi:hypothetical protein